MAKERPSFFERNRRPARSKSPKRKVNKLIYVFVEGRKTEKEYIDGFVRTYRSARVDVKIIPPSGVPMTLVNEAVKLRKTLVEDRAFDDDRDSIWCVFDFDQHPNIKPAIDRAVNSGINLGISNPCVELWILLHYEDFSSSIDYKQLQKRCSKHLLENGKSIQKQTIFEGYQSALARARKLVKLCETCNDIYRNPSTRFHLLTEEIATD